MVLEKLKDGAQWQLSVLDDKGTRRLIFVLCLPLLDGVFATLLVTGAISTFTDIVAISLTIFSGAGALAVLYSHAESRVEAKNMVFKATPALLVGAFLIALIAPIYEQLFYINRLRYAAGLALLVIAGHMAEIDIAEKFSTPAIILTGLVLSVKTSAAASLSLSYVVPALFTALAAAATLYVATYLTDRDMNMAYIEKGSSIVLVIIGLSMFGVSLPSELGLAVFAGSVLASLA